jgi:shikimate kinase
LAEAGPDRDRVLLIGMMGAGKSTVGHLVADRLGWAYLDTDEEILRRTGRTVPEIWRVEGEGAFRAEEVAVIAEVTTAPGPRVVSVAGGAVVDPANRGRIRQAGLVVWLRVRVATLVDRLGDGHGRPLLTGDPVGNLTRLEAVRRPTYESLAQLVIDVDDLAAPAVADRITADVERWRTGWPDPVGDGTATAGPGGR